MVKRKEYTNLSNSRKSGFCFECPERIWQDLAITAGKTNRNKINRETKNLRLKYQ
jgi:hypothetical protein